MLARDLCSDDERGLLDRAADWQQLSSLDELNPAVLRAVADREGIDFATAVLFDRIVKSPQHGPFIEAMTRLRKPVIERRAALGVTLAVAPGAFYIEHPETGADGKTIREAAESCGCRAELMPTLSVGTAAENGRVICEWLAGRNDEKIILLSLSKGGADIKMAFARQDASDAFRKVVAWLNVGGILDGSPMISWTRARRFPFWVYRLLFWLRGQDFRFVQELDRRPGGALDFELRAPDHVKLIHIAGFPLTRHLSGPRARRWHRRLAPLGPNDSVKVLSDLCNLPGLILPIWGADHYLQSGWNVHQLVAALLQYLGDELGLFRTAEPAGDIATNNQP